MNANMPDKNKSGSIHGHGVDWKAKKAKEKEKVKQKRKNKRLLLITVTVLGSTGPIRLMVNEDDPVYGVINAALKSYAREGRRPILGYDATHFLLYSAADFKAMGPTEAIGSSKGRSFVLSAQETDSSTGQRRPGRDDISHKATSRGGRWFAWLNKILSFK